MPNNLNIFIHNFYIYEKIHKYKKENMVFVLKFQIKIIKIIIKHLINFILFIIFILNYDFFFKLLKSL